MIRRTLCPVHELGDMNGILIDGQFNGSDSRAITKYTNYKIDKILVKRYRNVSLQYLLRLKGYGKDFDLLVPAASVKNI